MCIGQHNLNSLKGYIGRWVHNRLNIATTFIIVPSVMTHLHIPVVSIVIFFLLFVHSNGQINGQWTFLDILEHVLIYLYDFSYICIVLNR